MRTKQKVLFIVNPRSGVSDKYTIEQLVSKYLDIEHFAYEIQRTSYAGHAQSIAHYAAQNKSCDIIAVVGGDGSINEVVQALVGTSIKLAIVPAGSGNGLSYHIGIGRSIKHAIEVINVGKEVRIDVAKVNERYFINISGIGFDASVAYRARTLRRRGLWGYISTSIKLMPSRPKHFVKLSIDGKIIEDYFAFVIVANGSIYGYDFKIAPKADVSDGKLTVYTIKHMPTLTYIKDLPNIYAGRIEDLPYVDRHETVKLSIHYIDNEYYHYDGEGLHMTEDLHYSILPASIRLLVP